MKETAEEIMRMAQARDTRCALSLRVNALMELGMVLRQGQCFLVTLVGDCAKCKTCPSPSMCRCLRDHFQSTTNSKRRVSTYLFWKNKLGLGFPISDDMLERQVWKNLDSCDYGIKRGNGQRKQRSGPVCVNPYCYWPADPYAVLTPLASTLGLLNMTSDGIIRAALGGMGWDGAKFGSMDPAFGHKGFDLITGRVRQMIESQGQTPPPQVQAAPVQPAPAPAPTPAPVQMQLHMQPPPTLQPPQMENPYLTPVPSPADSVSSVASGGGYAAPSPTYSVASTGSPMHSSASYTPEHSPAYSMASFTASSPPEYMVPSPASSEGAVPTSPGLVSPINDDMDFEMLWGNTIQQDKPRPVQSAPSSALLADTAMMEGLHAMQFSQSHQQEVADLEAYLAGKLDDGRLGGGPSSAIPTADELDELLSMDIEALTSWDSHIDEQVMAGQVHAVCGLRFAPDHQVPQTSAAWTSCELPALPSFENGPIKMLQKLISGKKKAGEAEEEAAPAKGGGFAVDIACVPGHIVGTFNTSAGVRVERVTAANLDTAQHIGVLKASMVCMLGATAVKVRGPGKPGQNIYVDTSEDSSGCGVTTAPDDEAKQLVIGQVLAAPASAADCGADVENTVTAILSSGGSGRSQSKKAQVLATAVMRYKLKQTIADHLEKQDSSGGGGGGGGGADADATAVALEAMKVAIEDTEPAPADPGSQMAKSPEPATTEEEARQPPVVFQKVGSLEDGMVALLCSHSTMKTLRFCEDGTSVDGNGGLSPTSMMVVYEAGGSDYRLQYAADDFSWIRAKADGTVDCLGNPEDDETLFTAKTNADGGILLLSPSTGKFVSVSKSGAVEMADGAQKEASQFTVYQRLLF